MDGNVSFEYTVDAEPGYDGLEFYVDGERQLALVSTQTAPAVFAAALGRGYHTLAWRFVKDFSGSAGADAAWLRVLEVQGLTYSDDACTPCAPGSHAPAPGAGACTPCARNTHAAEAGATQCTPCAAGEYALEGAAACTPRTTCTAADYTAAYGACRWDAGAGAFVRARTYAWRATTTCDTRAATLPADEDGLACEPCNPGRVRSRATGRCTWCPRGTAAAAAAGTCVPCAPGTASTPGLAVLHWHEGYAFPPLSDGDGDDSSEDGQQEQAREQEREEEEEEDYDPYDGVFTTGCTGTCGTPGWTVVDGVAMSGVGHTAAVSSTLEMRFVLARASALTYTYFVATQNVYDARLQVSVAGATTASRAHWSGEHAAPATESIALAPGNHTVQFVFVRRTMLSAITHDAAYLYNITVPAAAARAHPAVATGSDRCTPCPAGSYTPPPATENSSETSDSSEGSAGGAEWCSLCEPGTSSPGGAGTTACTACARDTFNDAAGGLCRACGAGTHTAGAGATDCANPCTFEAAPGTVFDLGPLQRAAMYGPVTDGTPFSYYVSVCARGGATNATAPCRDAAGAPLAAYACQPQPVCPAGHACADFVTGTVAGYRVLDAAQPARGVVVEYTGGTRGCDGAARSTTVTVLCSPGRGAGAPAPPANRTVEGPPCHYELVWESEYGCPLCTAADYAFVYGECRNNVRRRMYYWLANPRRCHGGVALPPDDDVPANCSSRAVCPPGTFVDTATGACSPCAPGTASPGAGEVLARFPGTALPAQLASSCSAAAAAAAGGGAHESCRPFAVHNGVLRANTTGSTLRYTSRFLVNGTVSFDYTLLLLPASSSTADDESENDTVRLEVALDDRVVHTDRARGLHRATATVAVPEGGHTLTWTLVSSSSSSSSSEGAVLEIAEIRAYGNSYAPTSCSACAPGHHAPDAGAAACARCPAGEISAPGYTACQACAAGTYTRDGTACVPAPACTPQDWTALHTPCANGTRRRVWHKVSPAVCVGGYAPEESSTSEEEEEEVACAPCPAGMWREAGADACVGCAPGLVFDGAACVAPERGTVAFHTREYFGDSGDGETVLPAGWSTAGVAPTLPGDAAISWRVRADGIDAAAAPVGHSTAAVLTFATAELEGRGFVVFDYRVASDDTGTNALVFLVNGAPVALRATPLPNGFVRSQTVTLRGTPNATTTTLSWIARTETRSDDSSSSSSSSSNSSSVREGAAAVTLQNVRIGGLAHGTSTTHYCAPGSEADAAQRVCTACAPGTASNVSGTPCRACAADTCAPRAGARRCRACYAGTSTDTATGATRCTTACVFTAPRSSSIANGTNATAVATYNLTALRGVLVGPVTARALGGPFFFSVCDGVVPRGTCGSRAAADAHMHACHTDAAGAAQVSYGAALEFVAAEPGTRESDISFLLNFRDGDRASSSTEYDDEDNDEPRLQTTVLFRCSPTAGAGFPQFLSYSAETHTATFAWASQYACHTCGEGDYEEVVSACRHGRQRRELHKTAACHGADRVLVAETACTDIAVPAGLVAGAGALVLVLVGAVVFVVYRNRKITYKYTKLLQDQAADLESMADDDGHTSSHHNSTVMATKLVSSSHDDDDDSNEEDRAADEEEEEEDEDEDDGQGVGHIQK